MFFAKISLCFLLIYSSKVLALEKCKNIWVSYCHYDGVRVPHGTITTPDTGLYIGVPTPFYSGESWFQIPGKNFDVNRAFCTNDPSAFKWIPVDDKITRNETQGTKYFFPTDSIPLFYHHKKLQQLQMNCDARFEDQAPKTKKNPFYKWVLSVPSKKIPDYAMVVTDIDQTNNEKVYIGLVKYEGKAHIVKVHLESPWLQLDLPERTIYILNRRKVLILASDELQYDKFSWVEVDADKPTKDSKIFKCLKNGLLLVTGHLKACQGYTTEELILASPAQF